MKPRVLVLLVCLACLLPAQTPLGNLAVNFFDGNSNLIYTCSSAPNVGTILPNPGAPGEVPQSASVALGNLTNIVVLTGTATVTVPSNSKWNAGTYASMQIQVAGSATALLNGTYKVTSQNTNTTTFTFTTTAADGTYTDATISTLNPLLTQAAWQITVNTFDGSNRLTGSISAANGQILKCSDRTKY